MILENVFYTLFKENTGGYMYKCYKKIVCLLLVMVLTLSNVTFAVNDQREYEGDGEYVLAYSDEFNGSSINEDEWFYRETGKYHGGYNRRENVTASNGIAKIAYKHEDFNNDGVTDITGGGLISKPYFGYGKYEIRCRLFGDGPGFHQSFWLYSFSKNSTNVTQSEEYEAWKAANKYPADSTFVEIDGFETESNRPNHIQTNYHNWSAKTKRSGSAGHHHDITDWFTMAFEYLPDRINYYIDDELVYTQTAHHVFSQSNLWLTGLANNWLSGNLNYYFADGSTNTLDPNAGYEIDYFRYYNRHEYNTNRLTNPSFDITKEGDAVRFSEQIPSGWIESYDDEASKIKKYDANYVLRHAGLEDYRVTTKQIVENIPNGTYRLTARVRGSEAELHQMRAIPHINSPHELNVDIPVTNEWTTVTIDNIAVTYGEVLVAFSSIAEAGQWLEVDDIILTEVQGANYECEDLASTFVGNFEGTYTDQHARRFEVMYPHGDNDYIEYTIPNVSAGTYDINIAERIGANKGKYSVVINDVALPGVYDLYSQVTGYNNRLLSNITFDETGDQKIKLIVKGRNSSSSAKQLAFDSIQLIER